MRVEKRRVVLNIPRDLHSDLKSLWFDYRNEGYAPTKETFGQWLIRFMRDWRKRDFRRLQRRRKKYARLRDEALAEDARQEAEREV